MLPVPRKIARVATVRVAAEAGVVIAVRAVTFAAEAEAEADGIAIDRTVIF